MQVNPANTAVPAPTAPGAVAVARVVSGDLATLPVGVLLEATVTRSDPGATVLNLAGRTLTVRPPPGFPTNLPTGTVLVVRVPGGTATPNPPLELVGRPAVPTPEPDARPASASTTPAERGERPSPAPRTNPAPTSPPRVATVDVLSVLPDGRIRVRIDGGEEVATATARLPAGERSVVQVERTPTGLILRPLPDSPALAADVAAALLRGTRVPDLGAALKPLLAELAALQQPQQPGQPRATPPEVRNAAEAVMQTLRAFLPAEPRPPSAGELRQLVENGGLHFEAKLARAADQPDAPLPKGDLKGDLLRLFQVVRDLGATDVPAARATLDGIEAQQATNTLAQANGTPYFLQVPFPDAGEWRTLHLALEREARTGDEAEHRGSFRLLMHVPLTDLGETWIDAGLSGAQFRAVMYLDRAEARDRVRAELPSLRDELSGEGFGEVLLDVRPAGDLPAARRRLGSELRAGHPESVALLDVKV